MPAMRDRRPPSVTGNVRWCRVASSGGALIACALISAFVLAQQPETVGKRAAPGEMQRIGALVGTWDVEFEARDGPDQPFRRYRTTSTIKPLLDGAFLQEEVAQPMPKGPPIRLIGIWGYDRYREVYRFAWLDDTYALFDVHEGHWRDGALVVNNLRVATTLTLGGQVLHGQMTWSDITADGFAVDSSVSTDGGLTWWTQARGRYTRAR